MARLIVLLIIMMVSIAMNLPLGMWRVTVKKFSLKWFLSVHLAVPLIYLLRVSQGLPYWTIPILVASAVGGQITGGRMFKKYLKKKSTSLLSRT